MNRAASGGKLPTHIITGFLGVGKTTAIRSLFAQRPPGERWGIFVNEYGMVSLDHLLLDQAEPHIEIQELAGGCFCCTTSEFLKPALAGFIRRTHPDRLFIEPSGAGHPAGLIDTLRNHWFGERLALQPTVCLIDPQDFGNERVTNQAVFYDQIQMADIVVLNWLDRRDPDLVTRCRAWLTEFDPPKSRIHETTHARLEWDWLFSRQLVARLPRFGAAHHAPTEDAAEAPLVTLTSTPRPGAPIRLENSGLGQWACGWIFDREDVFDREALLDLLGYVHPILRIKGVFHCHDDWWVINRVGSETSFVPTAYRRDSRLEIILGHQTSGWPDFERKLLDCFRPRVTTTL
jgi:G3E family GTPase